MVAINHMKHMFCLVFAVTMQVQRPFGIYFSDNELNSGLNYVGPRLFSMSMSIVASLSVHGQYLSQCPVASISVHPLIMKCKSCTPTWQIART